MFHIIYGVASISSIGVNDHYTSVHVDNSEVVGEITEYTKLMEDPT